MLNTVSSLNHTLQETQNWLDDLVQRGPFENEQQAYSHFRAVLHAIRDWLTVEEAVHFSAQLPMLVRGFYFEGWRPSMAPNDEKSLEEFMNHVAHSLRDTGEGGTDLRESIRSIMSLLTDHLSEGQVRHVRGQLSEPVRELWAA